MRGLSRLGLVPRGAGAEFSIGNEPPLVVGDKIEEAPGRRAVSLRWLTGTILTGFTSIFLMGGALMAALNSPNQFAVLADTLDPAATVGGGALEFGQKGDRIRPLEQEIASRQILQVSTVSRQGERDFIKLRPFAKIIATLGNPKPEAADKIPAYDALRIFADNSVPDATAPEPTPADDQIYGAEVDGEVSVKISDFPLDTAEVEGGTGFDTPEVEQAVRTATNFAPDADAEIAALPYVDPTGFEEGADEDPFSALGVRIVPENVSNVAKSDIGETADNEVEEKILAVTKGKSFRAILESDDIKDGDIDQIVAALSEMVDLNQMHVGQKIRIAFAPDDDGEQEPIRVSVYDDGAHQATIARTDDDSFVRADEPNSTPADFADAEGELPTKGGLPRVYDALYATALEQEVPPQLIDQLIRIFAFDVDFQARISPGDALEIFHSMADPKDPDTTEPEVLFASLTLSGVTKRFYRFRSSDDGVVDFYDEEGKSAKKFLMRKPMSAGMLRSGFGMRKHPILGYRRMHTGVDYSSARGTPILAAGNGTVEKIGRTSGYGNFTLIRHTNGYETGYGHQSSFVKGLKPGSRVRQGQVIGYVGSTGLSTGPHLHFEIRVNGKPVDPLRIRLPRGRVLQADLLTGFEKERERIDALLGKNEPPTKVAEAASAN